MLQHILNCDVERTRLLGELDELAKMDDSEMTENQIAEKAYRMQTINERLEMIYASEAESKAIKILTGIGFSQGDLHKPSN